MEYLIAAVVSYLLGSIPTAYVVVKLFTGKNIWEVGSRNVGALNTYRATGNPLLAALVIITDVLKAWAAIYIVQTYFPSALVIAPFFVVLGHNFPVCTRFRGGRGIAVLLASAFYLQWEFFLTWVVLWLFGYLLSGYIAVGAVVANVFTAPVLAAVGKGASKALILATIPVLLKYGEKMELLISGKLPKHFWRVK